jgi:NAD-dependent dihydropyrimidine dehydrogenase PreA subunit
MTMRIADLVQSEIALQKIVAAYIVTGLLFLVLPGTFLGVWNLVSISSQHAVGTLSPAWIQAHGHAQIFGWLGTFIIGIGYYSLSKMGGLAPFAASRGWASWSLWTAGVTLRWIANVTEFEWRLFLPLSAGLQLVAFTIFFLTVSRHKPSSTKRKPIETWLIVVIASTMAFLLALAVNQVEAIVLALTAAHPEIPHWLDQRYLFLAGWGFPLLAVWGFNAKWLPVFLGLHEPNNRGLLLSMAALLSGIATAATGHFGTATLLLFGACVAATQSLHILQHSHKRAKTHGVSSLFPFFVRVSYVWLSFAGALGIYAAHSDVHGGIWGASRHALTVGFLATMVFAIGQRVLPAFCGMRLLFSKHLMGISLVALNIGCALRVLSEIPAYEANLHFAWSVLPVSAVTELAAVTLFGLNMAVTLLLPPPGAGSAKAGFAAGTFSNGMKSMEKWLPVINSAQCSGCGICVSLCAPACLGIPAGYSVLQYPGDCNSDGLCIRKCPQGAIEMQWTLCEVQMNRGIWRDRTQPASAPEARTRIPHCA